MMRKSALILTLLLVVSTVLSSCGTAPESSSSASSSGSSASSTPAASSAASESADGVQFDEKGISGVNQLPLVKDTIDFKIATPYAPAIIDYDTNEQTLKIEEDTNLNIIWEILPEQGSEEKINLLIASGTNMPDVFSACGGTFNSSMQATLGAQGIIAPLNDLIEKWQYNIAEWREVFPTAMNLLTAPDGNVYSLPGLGRNEANTLAQRFYINSVFLEALDMPLPTTTEEYYDYLVAVKTQDPNGNGKADEIPLAASPMGGWHQHIDGFLMQPFIYMDTGNSNSASGKKRWYLSDDGQIKYAFVEEGWKEAVKYLRRLYGEGLMSTEVFTMTKDELRTLVEYDEALIIGSLPSGGPHDFANTAGERRKDFEVLPPLAGPDGTRQAYWEKYAGVSSGFYVVMAQSQNQDVAVKLADYLYSLELSMWGRYGIEGRDWQIPAPGTISYTGGQADFEIINPDLLWGQPQTVYLAGRLPSWTRYQSYNGADTSGDPFHLEAVLYRAKELYEPYKTDQHVPPLNYTDSEGRERTDIVNNIYQFVTLSLTEFVTGARDIDAEWDSYIKECNNLGLPRLHEIDQGAFDRQWAEALGFK